MGLLNTLVLFVSFLVYVNGAAYNTIEDQLADMDKIVNNAMKSVNKFSDDTVENAKHDFGHMPPDFGDFPKRNFGGLDQPNLSENRQKSQFGSSFDSDFGNRHTSDFGNVQNHDFGTVPKLDFGDTHSNFGDMSRPDFGDKPKSNFGEIPKIDFGNIPQLNLGQIANDMLDLAVKADYESKKFERTYGNGSAIPSNSLFLLIVTAIFATIRFH